MKVSGTFVLMIALLNCFGAMKSVNSIGELSFTYQVKLSFKTAWWDFWHKTWCSGSILSPHWILTSAYCCYGMYSVKIHFANKITSHDLTSYDFVVHEKFDGNHTGNIALIKTKRLPIDGVAIAPVLLPSKPYSQYGKQNEFFVGGWGTFKNVQAPETYLMTMKLHIERCNTSFTNSKKCVDNPTVTMLIADYGSPVVFRTANGFIQTGMFTTTLTQDAYFYNIIKYIEWIEDKLKLS